MLNIPAAEEVLPNNRNHGLNPSEDFLLIIRKCCWVQNAVEARVSHSELCVRTCGAYEMSRPQHSPNVRLAVNQSWYYTRRLSQKCGEMLDSGLTGRQVSAIVACAMWTRIEQERNGRRLGHVVV